MPWAAIGAPRAHTVVRDRPGLPRLSPPSPLVKRSFTPSPACGRHRGPTVDSRTGLTDSSPACTSSLGPSLARHIGDAFTARGPSPGRPTCSVLALVPERTDCPRSSREALRVFNQLPPHDSQNRAQGEAPAEAPAFPRPRVQAPFWAANQILTLILLPGSHPSPLVLTHPAGPRPPVLHRAPSALAPSSAPAAAADTTCCPGRTAETSATTSTKIFGPLLYTTAHGLSVLTLCWSSRRWQWGQKKKRPASSPIVWSPASPPAEISAGIGGYR